ncbi:transcription factor-like protein DPB [Cinnamomum micranthum f. kanehirae]|uniref:Transcription factor-like protein DPB n=1 Tax=Cinnamomum micranthum f. kanehirae TaxID=337451 RepID=A0A3S3PIX1_9MAGN|nr:transcription factor-like protein DPB [Cinnamomum micranthum f. kanehirae]
MEGHSDVREKEEEERKRRKRERAGDGRPQRRARERGGREKGREMEVHSDVREKEEEERKGGRWKATATCARKRERGGRERERGGREKGREGKTGLGDRERVRNFMPKTTISCFLNSTASPGMGSRGNCQEDGKKKKKKMPSFSKAASTRSWGTSTNSGQSLSTGASGSAGSPSIRSELATATPAATESAFVRLNQQLDDALGDDDDTAGGRKKKRAARAVGGDKGGRGLRQFSMKVCEKVESKGRTTYNEVADELVAEFADPSNRVESPDRQQFDEKNIRRRVYDALNVLMAMDIISKDKKEIQWKGLPRTSLNDIEELKSECVGLRHRLEKKAAYLQELEDQFVGLQNLVQRNEQLYGSGNAPSGGVALPFILVQTRPHATVEVEISEDMQLVHFDFNSTPFELHDDAYVLKSMRLCGRQNKEGIHDPIVERGESSSMLSVYQHHIPRASAIRGQPASPPIPGILKARIKHEQ